MKPTKDSSNETQLKWWRSPGVIYFLAAGNPPSAIKIGVTTRATLLDRMRKTQTHNHEPIELLGVIRFDEGEFPTRDAEDQERLLHLRFAHLLRFKPGTRGSEWFSISAELLDWIGSTAITPEVLGVQRFVCTPVNRDMAS
ncbi:MAG: GIY-YIG nuclease family protein [Verrucomicrobiae bacterium]|nr:GIY-YIG nuclease family protein [Verrucomicrobiae bacterium]MCP5428631.1 GIY-YIG nuclease family protein [Chromatiaceae bacterium]